MYEEDFRQERRDREKAHGMLEELRGQLSYDKNLLEAELQECRTTITHLRSQVEDNSRRKELLHGNERLQRELLVLRDERDAAMQQVRSYKKQADGFKRELEERTRIEIETRAAKPIAEVWLKMFIEIYVCTCTCT